MLALLFVWKLQGKHAIEPKSGSEYKLTVVSVDENVVQPAAIVEP